jgi:hypothetical protein
VMTEPERDAIRADSHVLRDRQINQQVVHVLTEREREAISGAKPRVGGSSAGSIAAEANPSCSAPNSGRAPGVGPARSPTEVKHRLIY